MVYNKCITNEGKDQILKLAFLSNSANTFSYCALAEKGTNLASETGDAADFNEINGNGYHRVKITADDSKIENNTLTASCIFDDDNYFTETGKVIAEIGLCDSYDSDTPTFFAFSQVPNIEKTGSVSLKYTWVIHIE